MLSQYGKVEVFSLENGLYIFRFANESSSMLRIIPYSQKMETGYAIDENLNMLS
jgi:hypothetical protein